ncbi:hypothetical protein [Methylobacterium sp. Leaf118]|uniref:hypothetical protein n=1 Tax=Methylobacterium sp. Leaf118 TaxID=2876562 RepID=UPI001E342107|nr:hypothetical protein [Methylobacterium sp. Leaf118]
MTIRARTLLAASLVGAGLAASSLLGRAPALAQKAPEAAPSQPAVQPKPAAPAEASTPVALTQAQIDGLLAAQPELAKIDGGSADKPDPKAEAKAQAEAEAIVKRNGFESLAAFQDASESIDAVLEGIDPETKAYVGVTPLLKKQLAALEADKAMPAKDKAAAVEALKGAIAAGEPGGKPPEGNIALVTQNYDTLNAALGPDDGGNETNVAAPGKGGQEAPGNAPGKKK